METHRAAQLAAENMKTIFAYALHRVSNREDAEDLAGDIVVAVLENAHTLRCDDAFFGWFWSVAANTVKNYYREKRRPVFVETEEIPAEENAEDVLLRKEETALLRRELSLLAGEYRKCTVAYYFDGLTCRQIGEKYSISVEMVKYYLYKTRRILKEGLTMTRTYGEKSYKPADFYFMTIFSGAYNAEYRNLFNRKLPGNILYCAYYTPVTLQELSLELGVAAVYLEDEIELLKKYDLITENGGRFQTKLCIFTWDYDTELHRAAEEQLTGRMGEILASVKQKLSRIRQIGFHGCGLSDNRLLWAFLFKLMQEGHDRWRNRYEIEYPGTLYADAKGVNYAVDYNDPGSEYSSGAFAGHYGLREDLAACFANFGVLDIKNYVDSPDNWNRLQKLADESITGGADAPLVYLTDGETDCIFREILTEETEGMATIYRELAALAEGIMQEHAPKAVAAEIQAVIGSTIFHRTVGLMGKIAVDSGELHLPETSDDLPTAVYLYDTDVNRSGFLMRDCGDGTR